MNERAAPSSEKPSPAPHSAQITPPAAEEKRTAPAPGGPPQRAQSDSSGRKPAASSSFSRNASRFAGPAACGPRVEQLQLAAEQVVGGGVRLAVAEQPQHRLARRAGREDRAAVLAQPRVPLDRLRLGDGVQLPAALVEHQPHAEERLQPRRRSATSCGARPSRPRSRARACRCRGGRSGRPRAAASSAARRLRSCSSRPTVLLIQTSRQVKTPCRRLHFAARHRMEASSAQLEITRLHDRPLRPLHQGEGPAERARARLRRGQPRQGPGRPPRAGRVHRVR